MIFKTLKFIVAMSTPLLLANCAVVYTSNHTMASQTDLDVTNVKENAGISRTLFDRLEAFSPTSPSEGQKRLDKIVLRSEIQFNGKINSVGHRTLSYLHDQPGYVLVEFDNDGETGSKVLSYREFLPIIDQMHGRVHTRLTIVDVELPASFQNSVHSGAEWSYREAIVMTAPESKDSPPPQTPLRIEHTYACKNGSLTPARTLHPDLPGNMIIVECTNGAAGGSSIARYAYLEDFATFVPIFRSDPVQDQEVTSLRETIERVEIRH